MRSLLITNDFPPIISGIATYFFNLWRQQLQADRCMILAPSGSDTEVIDDQLECAIIRKWTPIGESIPAKLLKMLLNTIRGILIVKTQHIQKLHCGQILSAGLCGLVCQKIYGTPFTIYVCGSESVRFGRHLLIRKLILKILSVATEVVVNSESTFNEFRQFVPDQNKLIKITPGVDTTFFTPTEKRISDNIKTLLTVARLDERKGHDRVLQALPLILKIFPELYYIIVGDGREKERLHRLTEQLKLRSHVIFRGFVNSNELRTLYQQADVFILPNRITETDLQLRGDIEGFGIVFLEAAACGIPAIAGNNGGAVEAVIDSETGIIINPESVTDISNAVLRLLEKPELRMQLGQNGRRRVAEQFDWSVLASKIDKILI